MNKFRTEWNLALLYKGPNDPQIEKDLQETEKAYQAFEKKYRGKNFTKDPLALAKALQDEDALLKLPFSKPHHYFYFKCDLDSEDKVSRAKLVEIENRLTEASNRLQFFSLEIGKIKSSEQKKFLEHKALKPYAYGLKKAFENARYNLSEGEEQLASLLSQTSYSMWIDAQEALLSQQKVKLKGKWVPISKAQGELSELPKSERQKLYQELIKAYKATSHLAEAELNAIYNYKKVMDKRRGLKKPYSASVLSKENEETEIESLVAMVTKYFHLSQRFYKLHAKFLGEKKITNADRNVKIGKIKTKFSFETSAKILKEALSKIDQEYVEIFERFLKEGRFDVYPKQGKRGGAYCASAPLLPTYIFLNHVDSINSFETLAHEMGHAIHSELSKSQPLRYQGYSLAVAETASTFFEQVAMVELESKLSKKEKMISLHSRLQGDIVTIFRQIACFNFELELHNRIRESGFVSKEEIVSLMNKHTGTYMGPAVVQDKDDGFVFASWSHIRVFFYVYTYAYGQLVSRALLEKWREDKSFAKEIKKFLGAGGSMSPKDVFRSIGVDTSKPEFFELGLKNIEKDIDSLEKLSRK